MRHFRYFQGTARKAASMTDYEIIAQYADSGAQQLGVPRRVTFEVDALNGTVGNIRLIIAVYKFDVELNRWYLYRPSNLFGVLLFHPADVILATLAHENVNLTNAEFNDPVSEASDARYIDYQGVTKSIYGDYYSVIGSDNAPKLVCFESTICTLDFAKCSWVVRSTSDISEVIMKMCVTWSSVLDITRPQTTQV